MTSKVILDFGCAESMCSSYIRSGSPFCLDDAFAAQRHFEAYLCSARARACFMAKRKKNAR